MTMIQIRNVPERIHRTLKVRAAAAGMSLSDYLLREIEQIAELPTLEEVLAAIQREGSVQPIESSASVVRAERDAK